MSQRKQLVIYDPEGRTVVKLSDAFNDFDQLVELVQRHVAQRGDDTSQRLQSSKSRRSALITGGIGVIMLGVAGANVWIAREEQRSAKLLAEVAIPGEARIVRRFLAPNGVTPRLEYEVTGAGGRTAMRNAEVERALWDGLEGAETVPVLYVPDEPSISRLLAGEPEEDDPTKSPAVMYALSGAVALISLLGLVAAVLQWRGWDIDLDSKTGKISIKRFGTGR